MKNPDAKRNQTNNMHLDVELLSAYIDGEVTRQEASLVEHHLQECGSCSEELASLQWTVNLLREVPPVPVPRSFVVRPADIEPEPARQRFTFPNWLVNGLQWATVATAALAILVFAADFLTVGRPATAPAITQPPLALQTQREAAPMAVEEEAPAESAPPEAAEMAAPQAPATVAKEKTDAVELATGPEEEPARTENGRAITELQSESGETQSEDGPQQETAPPKATTEPEALTGQPGEQSQQALRAAEPPQTSQVVEQTVNESSSRDLFQILEISLLILLVAFLILTLWARRRRSA